MPRFPLAILALPLACALACALAGATAAQDAHYWTKQYGNRAYLLGGAVIGSADDVSAVYYNPALLTAAAGPNLTVAGNAFHATRVTLRNALGEELDLESTQVGALPSLVAGEIPLGGGPDRRLAYTLLFRHEVNLRFEQWGMTTIAGLPDEAAVRASLEEGLDEIWTGLGYAHRLCPALSVGATVFTTYRTHRSRRGTAAQAETATEFGVVTVRDDYDYYQIGALAKLGVGGRSGAWRYGLSVTTPTLRLAGSGETAFDRVAVIGDLDGTLVGTFLLSDFQRDLRSDYRSPFSCGAGAAFTAARTTLHVAAEWFAGVGSYRLLDAVPVVDEDTGVRVDPGLVAGADAVLNWGVGIEHGFTDGLRGYAGFHSDRSAARRDASRGALAVWDIWHASAGVSFGVGKTQVAAGVVHAFGSAPLEEDGGAPEVEAEYRSLLLLVGLGVDY